MALTDNLQAYWKLDETSGTRYDATANDNDLADDSSVGYGTGADAIINNSGAFVKASNDSLSLAAADQTGLAITGDLACSVWVKHSSLTPNAGDVSGIFARKDRYWFMSVYNQTSTKKFIVGIDGTGKVLEWVPTVDVWYYLVFNYDASAGTVDIYIDGDTTPYGTLTGFSTSISAADATVYIGTDGYGSVVDNFDGFIDELGIWDRMLLTSEITSLYNNGDGLAYPFSASGPANLKTYNTNALANIKSINTNLIANVKTLNTNA